MLLIIIIVILCRPAVRNKRFSRIILTGRSGDVVHYTAITCIGNDSDLGLLWLRDVIL